MFFLKAFIKNVWNSHLKVAEEFSGVFKILHQDFLQTKKKGKCMTLEQSVELIIIENLMIRR